MTPSKEVVQFKPQDFQEQLKEKIRAEIGNLIPDEQWTALVKQELDAFFNNKYEEGVGFQADTFRPAYLTKVCNEEIAKYCREKVQEVLRGEEWQKQWDGKGRAIASAAVSEILKQNANEIFASMFSGVAQNVVEYLQNNFNLTARY